MEWNLVFLHTFAVVAHEQTIAYYINFLNEGKSNTTRVYIIYLQGVV